MRIHTYSTQNKSYGNNAFHYPVRCYTVQPVYNGSLYKVATSQKQPASLAPISTT